METKNLPRTPGEYGPFLLDEEGKWHEIEYVPVSSEYVVRNWRGYERLDADR